MEIKNLHEEAQRLARLKPDFKQPVFTPEQLHPDGRYTEMDEHFYNQLGKVCAHFLQTRRKETK